MKRLLRNILPPFLTLIIGLTVWEMLCRLLEVRVFLVPAPSRVWHEAFANDEMRTMLLRATLTTASAAGAGFVLSAIVGIAVAGFLSTARVIERAFYPFTVFLQTVPLVAIAPLLVFWLEPGWPAVTVSAFIVSVFPVVAGTFNGLRSTEPALRDLFKLYGASRLAVLWKLKLPSALPSLFTGLRVSAGLAVIGAIVGEFVAGDLAGSGGLGIQVVAYNRNLRTDIVFAAVLLASGLGLFMFGIVNFIGYIFLRRWHASAVEN